MSNIKDWEEIEDPIHEHENFADILLDKVSIVDILNKYKIKLIQSQTGEFSHKAKCPFVNHLEGNERTASLYISELKNSFYCYGCNTGGDLIRFVSVYLGIPADEAMRHIAKVSGLIDCDFENISVERVARDPEKEVITHIFNSGVIIRDFLKTTKGKKEYNMWCRWADKRFKQLDEMLETLDDSDYETAKKYYTKIKNHISKYM